MRPRPGESSHRRFVRSVFLIALAALVAVAAGCASVENTKKGAAGGAVVGGAAGMELSIVCGPFAPICLVPMTAAGAVVGGVAGATVGAVQDAADADTARRKDAATPSSATTSSKHRSFVTLLPASDFSPAGVLLIDNSDIRASGSHEFSGTLVVNLDKPLDNSTKSIEEDIGVICTTGEVTYYWRRSFDDLNGSGNILKSEETSVPIPPGPELDAVKRRFCSSSSNG